MSDAAEKREKARAGAGLVKPGEAKGLIARFARRAQDVARHVPGMDLIEQRLKEIETRLLREFKLRLDEATGPSEEVSISAVLVSRSAEPPSARRPARRNPVDRLQALLQRSMEQTPEDAHDDLYCTLLSELVPDEARILSALSDGLSYPLLHVASGPPIGPVSRRVLNNVSNVGKAAGVSLQSQVPFYIEHLRALGLVETGPEDSAQKMKYEMLETDTAVRKALERISKQSRQSSRILRRTLRISELGSALWAAGQPADP